jgi:hypothetical protein
MVAGEAARHLDEARTAVERPVHQHHDRTVGRTDLLDVQVLHQAIPRIRSPSVAP